MPPIVIERLSHYEIAAKRHGIFERGHAVIAVQPMVKEILDWLDTHLGPVKLSP